MAEFKWTYPAVSAVGGVPAIAGVPTPIVNIPSTCVSADSAIPAVVIAS
jgi:hypothetical protein